MNDAAKIAAMKSALDTEALILSGSKNHLAANAIHSFMWNCEDASLVRLFDIIAPVPA